MLCLAVVAVVAVDGGGVCAPTPQKFFLTAIAVICKFVGNQPELILQRTYNEKEISFKVICESNTFVFETFTAPVRGAA